MNELIDCCCYYNIDGLKTYSGHKHWVKIARDREKKNQLRENKTRKFNLFYCEKK